MSHVSALPLLHEDIIYTRLKKKNTIALEDWSLNVVIKAVI